MKPHLRERCDRCNRKLKDLSSMARGMGPGCYRKHQEYAERFCINLFAEPAKGKEGNKR